MTNPISTLYGSPALDKASLEKTRRKAVDRSEGEAAGAEKAAKAAGQDEIVLSDVAKRAMAEPDFDRAKVEAIKQAISEGNYPLNSRRIAESFVAVEKLL